MKFLCIDCDTLMAFDERQLPGDGTFAASFACPSCGRRIAMLANEMETQLVNAMDVRIGGRTLREEPMALIRTSVSGRADALQDVTPTAGGAARVRARWSTESEERLARVPGFVRGMVKKIYADYAEEHGIAQITPEVMDRARSELGLEGM
ncbi:MAG: PCP reductase family protein [Gemmatimonadaceae bacterium]